MQSMRMVRASALAAIALVGPAAAAEQPPPAAPPSAAEVDALRRELQALKEQMADLQKKLEALSAEGAGGPAPGATGASATPGAPEATAAPNPEPAQSTPPLAPSGVAKSQNVMNPAISGVFQLIGNSALGGRDDANGFDLSEAEVAFESTVDPYAKMNLYLSFPADESPEVEEGYAQTLALPGGLQLKGGRFKTAFGKWNTLHTHAFPTVERPDVLQNFFGEESLTNDGLSLSWLIPNPKGLYLDATTEVGTARAGTAFNSEARALT